MKRIGIMLLCLSAACGCTRQEQAQQSLITQMSAGLEDVRTFSQKRQELLDSFYARQRQALDDAFDTDVQNAARLEAAWVIEHRKAYTTGIEAMWKARQASEAAHRQAMANLDTLDLGLQRLRWISELRQNWGEAFMKANKEVGNGQN